MGGKQPGQRSPEPTDRQAGQTSARSRASRAGRRLVVEALESRMLLASGTRPDLRSLVPAASIPSLLASRLAQTTIQLKQLGAMQNVASHAPGSTPNFSSAQLSALTKAVQQERQILLQQVNYTVPTTVPTAKPTTAP